MCTLSVHAVSPGTVEHADVLAGVPSATGAAPAAPAVTACGYQHDRNPDGAPEEVAPAQPAAYDAQPAPTTGHDSDDAVRELLPICMGAWRHVEWTGEKWEQAAIDRKSVHVVDAFNACADPIVGGISEVRP